MARGGGELCNANRRETAASGIGLFIAEGGTAAGSERLTRLADFLEKPWPRNGQLPIGNIRQSTV